MARKLFEFRATRARAGGLAVGIEYVVWDDEAATVLADISTSSGGSSIAGSTVTTADIAGLGPSACRFWGPADGQDTLWATCPSDPTLGVQRVEASTDARLDALEAGGASGIPGSIFDAKGDIIAASAADTAARLAVGANDSSLVADSSAATGLKWASPATVNLLDYGVAAAGTDWSDAVDAALAVLPSGADIYGGTLLVPARRDELGWGISRPIALPNGVRLKGDTVASSHIYARDDFVGAAMVKNAVEGQEFMWVEDVTLNARGVASCCLLMDTVYVNSGILRVLAKTAANEGIVISTAVTGSAGPIAVDDVWSIDHGKECLKISVNQRQMWLKNITAEDAGNGFAHVKIVCTNPTDSIGHLIDGLHMENYEAGTTKTGLLLDGVTGVDVRSVFTTGYGSGAFDDIVKIAGASKSISVSKIIAGAGTNLVNDTVNSVTIPTAGAGGYLHRYETDRVVGPGAPITPTTPTEIPGLQLWLKADAITGLVDGNSVTNWPDSSGQGKTATQATAGSKPTYKIDIRNGLPVVRFDGGDFLSCPMSAAIKPISILAVVNITDFSTARSILGATSDGWQLRTDTDGKLRMLKMGVASWASTGAVTAATWTLVEVTYDPSGNYAFYRNGTADGTGTNNQTPGASTTYIGVRDATTEFLLGDLAELLIYGAALSAFDLQAVETYLGNKYGITVA